MVNLHRFWNGSGVFWDVIYGIDKLRLELVCKNDQQVSLYDKAAEFAVIPWEMAEEALLNDWPIVL